MEKQEEPKQGLVERIKEITVLTAATASFIGLVTAAGIKEHRLKHIYNGPVNIPGIERVEAERMYDIDPSFNYIKHAGNETSVFLTNGEKASIRDYNGNFRLDERDTTTNLPPGIDANDVLKEVQDKAYSNS